VILGKKRKERKKYEHTKIQTEISELINIIVDAYCCISSSREKGYFKAHCA